MDSVRLSVVLGAVMVALGACADDDGGVGGTGSDGTGGSGSTADDGGTTSTTSSGGTSGGQSSGGSSGTSVDDGGTDGSDGGTTTTPNTTDAPDTSTGSGSSSPGSTAWPTTTTGGTPSVSTTGDTSTTGGAATGQKELCDEETVSIVPVPPRMLFVLDKSGSMYCIPWDHDGDPGTPEVTRWQTLYDVVEFVVTNFGTQIWFGASLYPTVNADCSTDCDNCNDQVCVVDPVGVPIAEDNGAAVLAGIPGRDARVQGATPMESGIEVALDYMRTLDPAHPRAMILVADGEISTTCTGERFSTALSLVSDGYSNDGIITYVVGITDVAEGQLNDLAEAGGRPRVGGPPWYYEANTEADLQEAMQQIVNDALSCTLSVAPEPEFLDLFEIWIEGTPVPEISDCATEDGWYWTQGYTEVEFCGTACDDLRLAGEAGLMYFCETG